MKFIITIGCVFILFVTVVSIFSLLTELFSLKGQILYFWIGGLISVVLSYFVKRSIGRVVFLHELTHAIWVKVFGGEVGTILVSKRRGGFVHHRGGYRWALPFITLAPYFFPLIPSGLVLLKLVVKSPYDNILSFFIGFSLISYYGDLFRVLKTSQPDIHENGVLFSALVIVSLNFLFLCIIFSSIVPGVTLLGMFMDGIDVLLHNPLG